MPGQISLEPLYEELDYVFNEASLRKAVRQFRNDLGGPDQSVFTTNAMQDHTSTVLETMAKSFLDFAQQPQNLSNSSDVPLWRLPLGSHDSNERTMLLNPEDAERALARLFEAQNRNLVNRTSNKLRNKHNERPPSGPRVAQRFTDIEDSITFDSPTSKTAEINSGTRGPSQTQSDKFSAAYTGNFPTATQGLLKRANVSKVPTAPVAPMTSVTTPGEQHFKPYPSRLCSGNFLDTLKTPSDPVNKFNSREWYLNNSKRRPNDQSTGRRNSEDQYFYPNFDASDRSTFGDTSGFDQQPCQPDQGHGQNQTQSERERVGLNGVRRKVVKLKLPPAKMLEITGSLDGRRPSPEADPTDGQRSPKRLKSCNGGHLPTPTPATLNGPREVQEPYEKQAFKQPTMEEIGVFTVKLGEKNQDQINSPMSFPEGLYGHPSHLQIDALDSRKHGEPMNNPQDYVQSHIENQEHRKNEASILLSASSFDRQAPPISALPSQSELLSASYDINLSAVTIPNHDPSVLIESAGQDSRASASASSPSDHAAMAGRDCDTEELEAPQDHTRNTAASYQNGRHAEGGERYFSKSHKDDENTQQVGGEGAVSESNNPKGITKNPDTSHQDGSQSGQPAELEDGSPPSNHTDNSKTVRPGQDLEEDPRKSSAGDRTELANRQPAEQPDLAITALPKNTPNPVEITQTASKSSKPPSKENTQSSTPIAKPNQSVKVRYYILQPHQVPETHEWTDTRFPEQILTIVFDTTTRLSHHTDFETINIKLETACRVHNREVKRGDRDRFEEIKEDYMAKMQAAATMNGNNGKPFELHYTPIGGNCSNLQAQASEPNGVVIDYYS